MIKVFYSENYNGRVIQHKKDFDGLQKLENWIFGQMCGPYSEMMNFPTPKEAAEAKEEAPWNIVFRPERTAPTYKIHRIDNWEGIIFSTGKMTNGQKHWSKEVQDWLTHCRERQDNPSFNFVE